MSVQDDNDATSRFSLIFLDAPDFELSALDSPAETRPGDTQIGAPDNVRKRRKSLQPPGGTKIRVPKAQKEFTLQSTVSMKRVVDRRVMGSGYPTVFRPQIGAVGGYVESGPRSGFIALFIAALCTLIVANSAPMDAVVRTLQSERPMAVASTAYDSDAPQSIFRPLFGPQAVSNCMKSCEASASSTDVNPCERACQKLSLTEYAHRITYVDSRPATDAKRIIASCQSSDLRISSYDDELEWEEQAIAATSVLQKAEARSVSGDFAKARLLYGSAVDIVSQLQRPPSSSPNEKETQLTENLIRAACLRAHHTLTELALVLVQQSSDRYSVRYYSELNQLIRPVMVKAETSVIKDAKSVLPKKAVHSPS
jgi:hypothetical protein